MPDFGFCGPSYEAPSIYQNAQELINWFCEKDITKDPQARGYISLYPTPGLTTKVTPQVAEVRSLFTAPGGAFFLTIVGNTLYTVDAAYNVISRGTLVTNSGPINITTNGPSAYFGDGVNRYTYTYASGTFATIAGTDGGFVGANRCDEVDNFIIYNQPNSQNWGATSANSTVSPALSVGKKDGSADNLVALIVLNRQVYLMGEKTSEVWIDVGAFPFPFQRIPGTSTQHGLAAKNSLAYLGNSFAYLSQDTRGQSLVMMMDGYQPTQISTHAVTQSLLGQVINDAVAYTYQMEGHEFYVLSFPTADITWVYDLSTQWWHKWLSVDTFNVFHRHRSNCSCLFQGQILVGDYNNGKIYSLSNTVYTEAGNVIRRLRRCPHLVADFHQFYFSLLQLQFQPGVGLPVGQGSDPQAMLRWSNDGGSTWSNEHWRSIGKIGKYRNRAIWRRLGQARDRVFEVVVTDPVKVVIVSANLEASPGAN